MKTATRVGVSVLSALAALTLGSGAAEAAAPVSSPASTTYAASTAYAQQQIDEQLAKQPGGERTGPDELTYDGGGFVFTAAAVPPADFSLRSTASVQATGSCPSGWFCAWQYSSRGGNRYQWQTTGVNQAITIGEFHSMENKRSAVTYLYTGANATGSRTCQPQGSYTSSLGAPFYQSKTIYNSTATSC